MLSLDIRRLSQYTSQAISDMTPTYFLRWQQNDGDGYKLHISFVMI